MCHIRCIHRPKKGKSNEGSPKIEGWKCCKNRSATARDVEILNNSNTRVDESMQHGQAKKTSNDLRNGMTISLSKTAKLKGYD